MGKATSATLVTMPGMNTPCQAITGGAVTPVVGTDRALLNTTTNKAPMGALFIVACQVWRNRPILEKGFPQLPPHGIRTLRQKTRDSER
jgi:hypothetical protein